MCLVEDITMAIHAQPGVEEVEAELHRRLLHSTRLGQLTAPLGSPAVFMLLGGSLSSGREVGWVILSTLFGVFMVGLTHGVLTSRFRVPRLAVQVLLVLNAAVAQGALFAFRPASGTREAVLETLVGTMMCIVQLVSLSADKWICRFTLLTGALFMVTTSTALEGVAPLALVAAAVSVCLVLFQMFMTLYSQQRGNVELSFENRRLIDVLQTANASLALEVVRDPLTGLTNRVGLFRELANERPVSVLYVDVDRFKSVNDTHGHAEGDRVLQLIGKELRAVTRESDVVARLGGDEFIVLLDGSNPQRATEIAQRVCEHVRAALQQVGVTVSIGVTCGTIGTETPDELVARADRALYEVKHRGGNGFSLVA